MRILMPIPTWMEPNVPQHSASRDHHADDGAPVSAADDELMMAIVGAAAIVFTALFAALIKAAL